MFVYVCSVRLSAYLSVPVSSIRYLTKVEDAVRGILDGRLSKSKFPVILPGKTKATDTGDEPEDKPESEPEDDDEGACVPVCECRVCCYSSSLPLHACTLPRRYSLTLQLFDTHSHTCT